MNADRVLAVRREVNRQRKAGHTEAAIARALTAARIAPPSSEAWRQAGVGPSWTAAGVTRFMETTRHVKPAPVKVTAAPAVTPPTRRVTGVRGDMIFTSAPEPAHLVHFP